MTTWDTAIALTLVISFASWLVVHAAIAMALFRRHEPRWTVCLLALPPLFWLAPYWGLKHRLHARVGLWLACVVIYAVALTLAVLSSSGT